MTRRVSPSAARITLASIPRSSDASTMCRIDAHFPYNK